MFSATDRYLPITRHHSNLQAFLIQQTMAVHERTDLGKAAEGLKNPATLMRENGPLGICAVLTCSAIKWSKQSQNELTDPTQTSSGFLNTACL